MSIAVALTGVSRVVSTRSLRSHRAAATPTPRTILDNISLTVRTGQIAALLGPNGAGKSTTVDLVAGLQQPDAGEVRVFGHDPAHDRGPITRLVGVQPQSGALPPFLTVDETLRLFSALRGDSGDTAQLRGRLGLDDVRRTRVRHLSGGQQRRLLIGTALLGQPELILLDEPSAGLDPAMRREVDDLIREIRSTGTTILLTTHHLDEAYALCDHVAILARGRIMLAGTPAELTREAATDTRVSFTVRNGTTDATIHEVVGPLWESTPIHGGARITVRTSEPDTLLRRLTFHRDIAASGITVQTPTLEDAYLAATS